MLSNDDAKIVDADPSIPGLRLLLDDEAALALFQEHLASLQPVKATCTYLRYKPSLSCLAAFRVSTPSGDVQVHAQAYSSTNEGKIVKTPRNHQQTSSAGQGTVVLSRLKVVLWPFPHDEALEALPLICDHEKLIRLIGRLCADFEIASDLEILPLRYKPGRRFVGFLEQQGRPTALLRLHSEPSYNNSRRAAKSLGDIQAVRTPRTIGHSDRYHALLLEWLEGDSLASVLTNSAARRTAMERVGQHLAALHREQHAKLPLRSPHSDAAILSNLVKDSQFLGPAIVTELKKLVTRCCSLLVVTPNILSTVHGDFHSGQVILSADSRVGFIDFDRASIAHPCSDLGTFLAQQERDSLDALYSTETKQGYENALLQGYLDGNDGADLQPTIIYKVASLLKLAHEPFRHRETDWVKKTSAILSRCSQLLDSAELASSRTSTTSISRVAGANAKTLPTDKLLPQLAEALDFIQAKENLSSLVQECCSNSELNLESVRLLRHKPGRRCLIAYDFIDHVHQLRKTVLGKIHAKGRHERSFKLQQDLWECGFDEWSVDGISIPRPVGIVNQWNMWLQEYVPGQDCWQALHGPKQQRVAMQLGAAVVKLSQAGVLTNRTHDVWDELKILQEKLPTVACKMPHLERRIDNVLSGCRRLSEETSSRIEVGIHRDFYPDQVVIDGERIYVLDHDLYCMGDPCLDIANFCAHLIERGIREPANAVAWEHASNAILNDFVTLSSCFDASVVESYLTLSLARHIYLSTQFPKRRYTTETMLQICERRLEPSRVS